MLKSYNRHLASLRVRENRPPGNGGFEIWRAPGLDSGFLGFPGLDSGFRPRGIGRDWPDWVDGPNFLRKNAPERLRPKIVQNLESCGATDAKSRTLERVMPLAVQNLEPCGVTNAKPRTLGRVVPLAGQNLEPYGSLVPQKPAVAEMDKNLPKSIILLPPATVFGATAFLRKSVPERRRPRIAQNREPCGATNAKSRTLGRVMPPAVQNLEPCGSTNAKSRTLGRVMPPAGQNLEPYGSREPQKPAVAEIDNNGQKSIKGWQDSETSEN